MRSPSLALARPGFVRRWDQTVRRHGLVAVIQTETPVLNRSGRFRFQAYVGSVFPRDQARAPATAILVPGRDPRSHRAVIEQAVLKAGVGVPKPWPYPPCNAALLWQSLLGRPYCSLVWIQGHVMLYLGPVAHSQVGGSNGFMTYQNLWGLRPRDLPDERAIVAGSVLFPVLDHYPEAPDLRSLADREQLVVSTLGEPPGQP